MCFSESTGTWVLSMTGVVAVPLRAFQFKAWNGTASDMDRRIAYHQAHVLLAPLRSKIIFFLLLGEMV